MALYRSLRFGFSLSMLALFSLSSLAAFGAAPKAGNGAWITGEDPTWVSHLHTYNQQAKADKKILYLFTHAGSVRVHTSAQTLSVDYSPQTTHFYENFKSFGGYEIFPALSLSLGDSNINAWPKKRLTSAAMNLTNRLASQPRIRGLLLDVKDYSEAQLPLYRALSRVLAKRKQTLILSVPQTAITETLFSAVGENGIVMVRTALPPVPTQTEQHHPLTPYQFSKAIEASLTEAKALSTKTGTAFMMALPAAATTGLWSEKKQCVGKRCVRYENPYEPAAYLEAALSTLEKAQKGTHYLGYALRSFQFEQPEQARQPTRLSTASWKVITKHS